MAIAQIEIAGKLVGLRFGLPAIMRIFENGADENDLFVKSGEKNIFSQIGISKILYAGYWNDCKAKDKIPELKPEDFYDLVEEQFLEGKLRSDVIEAMNVFGESTAVKKAVTKVQEAVEQVEKKNKIIGMPLNHSPMENSA